jgi:two-component system sensor histidine kinase KdpD
MRGRDGPQDGTALHMGTRFIGVRISEPLTLRLQLVLPYGLGLLLVGVATPVVLLLGPQHLTNGAMLYLAGVFVTAIVAGRGPAIAASLVAFFAFNFFFTEPRYTLTVTDPSVLVVLFTFLLVAIVTSQLAAAQRSRAEEAEAREREARLLHDIADLLASRPLEAALETVAERIRSELQLTAVGIDLNASDVPVGLVAVGDEAAVRAAHPPAAPVSVLGRSESANANQPGEPGRWMRISPPRGERAASKTRGFIRVPIRAGNEPLGDLLLIAGPSQGPLGRREARLLATAAGQLGLAVAQDRMRRRSTNAEVLRRSNELKNALLDAVSHDLRTPLSSIIGAAGTLRLADVEWSQAERREFAAAIEREAERLNRIVGNLLDLSRIQGGALAPALDWHDAGLLLRSAIERLRPAVAGHELVLDIPPNLPAVLMDPVEIDQVIANLIENAAKYSAAGGAIRIAAFVEGQELQVVVEDDGPGLPPEALPRLFEPFYRAPGAQRVRGSGLGLAVARGLVTAHGGRMWAENRVQGGARFGFTLPVPLFGVGAIE